jgi:AraC-like DNA-binding protein
MLHQIKRYPVKHPVLIKYIKFFWEIHTEPIKLNHKMIPQRNINLRFNLNDTPQFVRLNDKDHLLEEVFFSGLQDHYHEAQMKLDGKVDMLGVSFLPDAFYPLMNIPVSEFKNQFLGAREIGFKQANSISDRLKAAPDVSARLEILEDDLSKIFSRVDPVPENFRHIFSAIRQRHNPQQLSSFCQQNNIGTRRLERLYKKYVGVSANTFITLNRFQASLNQLLSKDFAKLSDVAYDNGYFDQMHFIRDFKRFAGSTPKGFVQQNNSILQIGKLT